MPNHFCFRFLIIFRHFSCLRLWRIVLLVFALVIHSQLRFIFSSLWDVIITEAWNNFGFFLSFSLFFFLITSWRLNTSLEWTQRARGARVPRLWVFSLGVVVEEAAQRFYLKSWPPPSREITRSLGIKNESSGCSSWQRPAGRGKGYGHEEEVVLLVEKGPHRCPGCLSTDPAMWMAILSQILVAASNRTKRIVKRCPERNPFAWSREAEGTPSNRKSSVPLIWF